MLRIRTATLDRPRAGRILVGVLAALVVLYGAALRLDAIALKYGPVTTPGWLRSVQLSVVSLGLRPSRATREPVPEYPHREGTPSSYISDPSSMATLRPASRRGGALSCGFHCRALRITA